MIFRLLFYSGRMVPTPFSSAFIRMDWPTAISLLPTDPGRHEESPGWLVLHQHIRDDLFEGRITLRLTAEHRSQILVDSVTKRDYPTVFLLQSILLSGKPLLLQAVNGLFRNNHDLGVAILGPVLFRGHFSTLLSQNNDVLSFNHPFSRR